MDVVTLSETFLTKYVEHNDVTMNGYTLMGIQDRPDDLRVEKECGGSVASYMKDELSAHVKPREDLDENRLEATFIELQLPKCVIDSVYRM